jgi:hypothetical protein
MSMKWLVFLMSLALAAPAFAQQQKPAVEKPAAQKASKKPDLAKKSDSRHSRRHEDARHCLERPTNVEIIKCAEAYL